MHIRSWHRFTVIILLVCVLIVLEHTRRIQVVFAVPIVTYHEILAVSESSPARVKLGVEEFRADIVHYVEEGYTPVTFADVVAYATFRRFSLPEKPIILTFDDGWSGQVRNAYPILVEHDFVATFFLNSGLIESDTAYLTWDEVRMLHQGGMEIGGHGIHHLELAALDNETLIAEIEEDKQMIEAALGTQIHAFSYPYNTYTNEVVSAVQAAGYRTARTGSALNTERSLYTLRSMIR